MAETSGNRGDTMGSSKRIEVEILGWVKFIFDMACGVLITVYYIIKEFVEMILKTKSKSLAGKHVLVTGAARGLGREICLCLAHEGCTLTCVDVLEDACKETAKLCNSINANCAVSLVCDITDRREVNELVNNVKPVDILVNNAGIVSSNGILDVTEQHIERMMNVNVMAHFWTIRAFLPGMIQRGGGHIVAIASAAAFTACANIAPYAATKYAVTGMMASLREEFRWYHPEIKTTSVHPFFIAPPASSVEHWDKQSRLPDVTAPYVAEMTVKGIKEERQTVTVPSHLYFLLWLIKILPSPAGEMWRDMFYAKINSLDNKVKSS